MNGRYRVYADSLRGHDQTASHDDKRATVHLQAPLGLSRLHNMLLQICVKGSEQAQQRPRACSDRGHSAWFWSFQPPAPLQQLSTMCVTCCSLITSGLIRTPQHSRRIIQTGFLTGLLRISCGAPVDSHRDASATVGDCGTGESISGNETRARC